MQAFAGARWSRLRLLSISKPSYPALKLMDELVNLVVQKTGISQDDARKAVEVIVNELKTKLPGPISSHIDSFSAAVLAAG